MKRSRTAALCLIAQEDFKQPFEEAVRLRGGAVTENEIDSVVAGRVFVDVIERITTLIAEEVDANEKDPVAAAAYQKIIDNALRTTLADAAEKWPTRN